MENWINSAREVSYANIQEVGKILAQLGTNSPGNILSLMKHKIIASENVLLKKFKSKDKHSSLIKAMNYCISKSGTGKVFVLKISKARKMLENDPPKQMLKVLGYKTVSEMLQKEDIFEIYCALRFVQDDKWMHKFFDENYSRIKKSDFEQRRIRFVLMNKRWLKFAKDFIKKKRHPTSHLKELGVTFALQAPMDKKGDFIKAFSVLVQFVYEVGFYTSLFRMYCNAAGFPKKFVSLLKGEIPSKPMPGKVLIVQRYMYKDNPNDWRIKAPHVNPEALHWKRAEDFIVKLHKSLEFWKDHYWVGFIFNGKLISFDFADNVVSVDFPQQLSYHYKEGLWYRIFEEQYGKDNLIKLMMKNIFKMHI